MRVLTEAQKEAARDRARRWHLANRQRHLDYMRERRQTYPEKTSEEVAAAKRKNPEHYREVNRRYRTLNATRIQRVQRANYLKNRDGRLAAAARNRRETTPEQNRAKNLKRRNAPLTPDGRMWVRLVSSDPCSYCGGQSSVIDHILPIARGGNSDWDNLTAACRPCNAAKHSLGVVAFMLRGTPA
jgi:5-methylcytosine-specific restriction endonuclease McrA